MENIKNYAVYQARMDKTIPEKLFWTKILPSDAWDTCIDYGCAAGTLLGVLQEQYPDKIYVGIDNNDAFLSKAKELYPDISFVTPNGYGNMPHSTHAVLNLSSVLHEIYNYLSEAEIEEFWKLVLSVNAKYICVRDMFWDKSNEQIQTPGVLPFLSAEEKSRRDDFGSMYGSMTAPKNMCHYLLTYKYAENWERECAENYFAVPQNWMTKLSGKYKVLYWNYASLPFIHDTVRQDFGIDMPWKTHMKVIFKRLDP